MWCDESQVSENWRGGVCYGAGEGEGPRTFRIKFSMDFDASGLIVSLWDKIGFDETERESERGKLHEKLVQVFQEYLDSGNSLCKFMETEIESIMSKHRSLLHAFKDTETVERASDQSLKVQLQKATENYQIYLAKCQPTIDQYNEIERNLVTLLETMGMDSLHITQEAPDYSEENIAKRRSLLASTQKIFEERSSQFRDIKASITAISSDLAETIPSNVESALSSGSLSDETIKIAIDYESKLSSLKRARLSEMGSVAQKITRLWEVLAIDQSERMKFLESHNTLSMEALEACKREYARLTEQRDARLQDLIERQKEEVAALREYLQIELESAAVDESDLRAVFDRNEEEIVKLADMKKRMSPIIDVVLQREEMNREFEELQRVIAKEAQAKVPDTKKMNRDEQAKRRVKSLLPRLEKKLLIMLLEYKFANEEDFVWKGEVYADKLAHIKISETELKNARKKSRKSLQPRASLGQTKTKATGARRASENSKKSINVH